jgi:hypothetical protein
MCDDRRRPTWTFEYFWSKLGSLLRFWQLMISDCQHGRLSLDAISMAFLRRRWSTSLTAASARTHPSSDRRPVPESLVCSGPAPYFMVSILPIGLRRCSGVIYGLPPGGRSDSQYYVTKSRVRSSEPPPCPLARFTDVRSLRPRRLHHSRCS